MLREVENRDYQNMWVAEPCILDTDYRTVECDGIAVAIFGFQLVSPGVGHCWVSVNLTSLKHAVAIVRAGRECVELAFEKYAIHRLQTTVEGNDFRMFRMMELCGFKAESVMRAASPGGDDMIMYRLLREN